MEVPEDHLERGDTESQVVPEDGKMMARSKESRNAFAFPASAVLNRTCCDRTLYSSVFVKPYLRPKGS